MQARAVVDHALDDVGPGSVGQHGDEAMHLAIEPHVIEHLAAVGLERAAVVVQFNTGHKRDDAVGDLRGQPPRERAILAVLAPAADQVAALRLHLLKHERDVVRVVLQIGVHQGDDRAVGVVNAGLDSGGLPEVAAQQHGAHRLRLRFGQGDDLLAAGVAAAVVHVDDLVAQRQPVEHAG